VNLCLQQFAQHNLHFGGVNNSGIGNAHGFFGFKAFSHERAVMAAGLASARADGLPAYLETTNPGNVELYRRSGWQVTAERSVGELMVWVMRHPG
jgi:aldehyde dehydrogenase (NAD+)